MILLIELQTSYTCVQINSICFWRGVLDNGDVSPVSLSPPLKYTPSSNLSSPHLPDLREAWVEPKGVCVPQGPCFL